jgi:NAD(P)-dependent dehydrogenase (short-subunit alcohol dehydrogenase family)
MSVLAEVEGSGTSSALCYADLSQPDAPETIVEALEQQEMQPDIMVLNAAVQTRKPFAEVTREDLHWQIETNFVTNFRLIQLLSPAMIERGWGRIVCIGSVQEALPSLDFTVYAAMKSAQRNLVENLARLLGPKGVTVNNLAPGVFVTDRNVEALRNPEFSAKVKAKIPVGYFAESPDCVGAALLLCSDVGRYINGATFRVDGGMSLPQ